MYSCNSAREEEVGLEKKITPMTPIEIKSYLGPFSALFVKYWGPKIPKVSFLLDTIYILYNND